PPQLPTPSLPPVIPPAARPPAPAPPTLPTSLRCAECRDAQSPPASPPGSFPDAGGCRSCTCCPVCKDRSLLPSGGETGCPPAREPADRCPARSPLHPARL